MTTLPPKHKGNMTTGRFSARIMYVLVIIAALVFCAFYLVGFDIPYDENPVFNAPLLTDAVLCMIYLFVLAAAVLTIVSSVNGLRRRDPSAAVVNNIPVARITYMITAFTALCLAVTFFAGSSEPMTVNGTKYTDTFWLKTTDMLINTVSVLLVVAVCGVSFGLSGYNRKIRLNKKVRHEKP